MSYFEFSNLVKVISGDDALENLGYELDYFKVKKPLVLSDAMLVKLGTVDIIKKCNRDYDFSTLYTDIPIDSSMQEIKKIKDFYISKNCDGILAVGGGSVIDTAKMVKLMLSQNEDDIKKLMGSERVQRGKEIPFIVIPTTSGTGAEMTSVAVIKDTENDKKYEFISSELLPNVALLDIRMTMGMPPKLTASTGIDALCHAVEAYSCNQKNPISDALASVAIEKLYNNIVVATVDGKDKKARMEMSEGSLIAGLSFSNSMVGLVHAIAHSIGGVAKVSHGDAISLMIVPVLEFNKEYARQEYSKMLMFTLGDEVYAKTKKEERADAFIGSIKELLERLRAVGALPKNLRDRGVKDYQLEEIAKLSINDGAILLNKRKATKEQILELLKSVF